MYLMAKGLPPWQHRFNGDTATSKEGWTECTQQPYSGPLSAMVKNSANKEIAPFF